MKLLLIEDDKQISDFIGKGLQQAGFAVDIADNGTDGQHLILNEVYDIAIIDLMLPGVDGLQIIENMRGQGVRIPVIILSARHTVDDRVQGLYSGADDYLVKPFAFSELLARVQTLLRRTMETTAPTRLTIGDLSLDLLTREVKRGSVQFDLQPKEFSLLEYMVRNQGRVVSKTSILEHLWDYQFDPQTNVVDVLIYRLRNKIDRDFDQKLIHTLRGVGYVLKSN